MTTLKSYKQSVFKELMSSVEGSPVKTFPTLAQELAWRVRGLVSGESTGDSFATFDRDSQSWKTSQASLVSEQEEFTETWPRSGMIVSGSAYQRVPLARSTDAIDGGALLPTVIQRDYRFPGRSRKERTGSTSGDPLPQRIGGPLNPTWIEWFMGYPKGWTELKD